MLKQNFNKNFPAGKIVRDIDTLEQTLPNSKFPVIIGSDYLALSSLLTLITTCSMALTLS